MKRTQHGSTAWSLRPDTERLRQPQDGAPAGKSKVANIHSSQKLREEADDARLTGGTRSLPRRLLGLNFGLKKSGTLMVQRPRVA